MSERVSPTKVGLWFSGATALLALGALGGAAYVTPATPASLKAHGEITSFPVESTTFMDVRSVRLAVARGEPTALNSPSAGRVTSQSCHPGARLVSGTSAYSLNDQPVVALSTALPLWRDLSVGDKGNDVLALQQELARLGHSVEQSGTLGKATLNAVNDLLKAAGGTALAQTVTLDKFIWIPEATTVVERCDLPTGKEVRVGDEVATVPGRLTSVSLLDEPPDDLVDGPRVVVVDDVRIAVELGAAITDPALLDQLAAAPSLRTTDPEEPAVAQLALTEPIAVSVLPPAAIVASSDGPSCVQSGDRVSNVRIIGSELGQTFVVFEGPEMKTVDTSPVRGTLCT